MSTILIIDDDAQLNLMLKSALELKGYTVDTACNGKKAKSANNSGADFPAVYFCCV